MERRIRLGALTACLFLVVAAAVSGTQPGGTAQTVVLDGFPVLGAALLITYGVLLSRHDGKEPINAVRALEPAERRQVRRAWRHPGSVPPHLREIARAHAQARARNDALLGWALAAVALWSIAAAAESGQALAVHLVLGGTPVLAGFLVDDLALRWHRGAAENTPRGRGKARGNEDLSRHGR